MNTCCSVPVRMTLLTSIVSGFFFVYENVHPRLYDFRCTPLAGKFRNISIVIAEIDHDLIAAQTSFLPGCTLCAHTCDVTGFARVILAVVRLHINKTIRHAKLLQIQPYVA